MASIRLCVLQRGFVFDFGQGMISLLKFERQVTTGLVSIQFGIPKSTVGDIWRDREIQREYSLRHVLASVPCTLYVLYVEYIIIKT